MRERFHLFQILNLWLILCRQNMAELLARTSSLTLMQKDVASLTARVEASAEGMHAIA